MTIMEGMLRPVAGMGDGGVLFTASLRASWSSLRAGRWSSTVGRFVCASLPSSSVVFVRDG